MWLVCEGRFRVERSVVMSAYVGGFERVYLSMGWRRSNIGLIYKGYRRVAEGMPDDDGSYDAEAIADNLSEKQVDLLLEFDEHEHRNSKQLRAETGIDTTTVNNQFRRVSFNFVDEGLMSFTGYDERETTPGNNHPTKYQITEKGRTVLDVFRQRDIENSVDLNKFDELRDEVERAEKERDKLRADMVELEERFDGLKGWVKDNVRASR